MAARGTARLGDYAKREKGFGCFCWSFHPPAIFAIECSENVASGRNVCGHWGDERGRSSYCRRGLARCGHIEPLASQRRLDLLGGGGDWRSFRLRHFSRPSESIAEKWCEGARHAHGCIRITAVDRRAGFGSIVERSERRRNDLCRPARAS